MRLFAFILIFSILSSSIIPCHAGEHEHHACSHHEHHDHEHGHDHDDDSSNEQEKDDHPCSPFCGGHSSVSIPAAKPTTIADDFSFTENIEKQFTYTPTYFYLQEFSIWNPPKI